MRDDLEKRGHERLYRPGELLHSSRGIRPRDEAIILIQHGRAKETIIAAGGRQLIWSICRPGDLVGIVACIGWQRPHCDVIALTEVQALAFSDREFDTFLERHPGLWKQIATAMATEVGAAQERMTEMAFDKAAGRLAAILLDLTQPWRHGRQLRDVEIPLTQDDLANLLGTRRETVERTLQDWRNQNIIATKPRKITILQAEALAQIAGTSISTVESNMAIDGDGGCSSPVHMHTRVNG